MNELERLQEEARLKKEAYDALVLKRMGAERKLMDEVKVRIRAEFGDAEMKAYDVSAEATARLRAEMERQAVEQAEAKLPYPLGTRMVLWERTRYGAGIRPTTTVGIIEIFKRGDERALNRRWMSPNPGDVVVRVLTKDGKPGKRADSLTFAKDWVKEGEKHKEYRA